MQDGWELGGVNVLVLKRDNTHSPAPGFMFSETMFFKVFRSNDFQYNRLHLDWFSSMRNQMTCKYCGGLGSYYPGYFNYLHYKSLL